MIIILHWSDWLKQPKVERAASWSAAQQHVDTLPNNRTAFIFDTTAPGDPWRGLDAYRGRQLAEIYMALSGEDIASGRFTNYDSGRQRTEALITRLASESPEIQLVEIPTVEEHEETVAAAPEVKTRKPRKFKPPELGQFVSVRTGTKLAEFLTLAAEGTRTVDELAVEQGIDKRDVSALLRSSLGKMHGIGHNIDEDGVVTIIPPPGRSLASLIKERAEPRAKPNGDAAPRRTKHDDAMDRAREGEAPGHLVITSEANKHRQKAVDRLEKLAADGDWEGVRKFQMNGIDTYSKMINRHRDLILAAYEANQPQQQVAE